MRRGRAGAAESGKGEEGVAVAYEVGAVEVAAAGCGAAEGMMG